MRRATFGWMARGLVFTSLGAPAPFTASAQVADPVTLERVFTFPSGATDERYAFHRIRDIAVAADGRILVFDQARLGVRVFGPDGAY